MNIESHLSSVTYTEVGQPTSTPEVRPQYGIEWASAVVGGSLIIAGVLTGISALAERSHRRGRARMASAMIQTDPTARKLLPDINIGIDQLIRIVKPSRL